MRFVEEVVVDEFLPTVRSLLAAELRDRGLTQREVAEVLGVSQSAVSKYAHGEVQRNDRIATDERVTALVEGLGEGLATGETTRVQALLEIEVLIRELERGDLLATLHAEAEPELENRDQFSVHDPDSGLRAAERTLASVRRGLRMLENTSGFAGLIPAVGSNLVVALPEAQDLEDVAAVPGRILDVKGRATIPGDPEFGVSEHVASVLLAAQEQGHTARAALNIRYTPEIVEEFAALGHVTASFDPEVDLEEGVADALKRVPDASVLYQTGAMGVEPIVYLLAADGPAAAAAVREVL